MTADRCESLDEFDLLKEDAAEFGLSWDGPPTVTRHRAVPGISQTSLTSSLNALRPRVATDISPEPDCCRT